MQQIPRHQLRRWCWYAGRGRNGNVGLWNGEEFLVVTATLRPSIKQEPYFDAEGGCFQPFICIDEGVVRQPLREQGLVTRYALDMGYGAECAGELEAVLEAAETLPVIVGGSSALSLSRGNRPSLAEVMLLTSATRADDVMRQLKLDDQGEGRRASDRLASGRLGIRVQVVPDDVFDALYGMSVKRPPSQVVTLSPAGVLVCCLWDGTLGAMQRQSAEAVALDALDCLAEEDLIAAEAFLVARNWTLAQDLLAEWQELALRRRWSWSEVVLERRRLQAERLRKGSVSPP